MTSLSVESKNKFYYDACALGSEETYRGIVNNKNSNEHIISHLSLGEAFGNSLCKGDDVLRSFLELMETIKRKIKIVGNDVKPDLFQDILENINSLTPTDALHLATAINHECSNFKTTDSDFLGGKIPAMCKKLAQSYSIGNFLIIDADTQRTSSYAKKHKTNH